MKLYLHLNHADVVPPVAYGRGPPATVLLHQSHHHGLLLGETPAANHSRGSGDKLHQLVLVVLQAHLK